MTRQVEKKKKNAHAYYKNSATVCIDFQQNMYNCTKCISWSFYLLHM